MEAATDFTCFGFWGSAAAPVATHGRADRLLQQELFCCLLARKKSIFVPWLTLTTQPRAVCFMAEPVTVSAAVTETCRLSCALELLQKTMLCFGRKDVLQARTKAHRVMCDFSHPFNEGVC